MAKLSTPSISISLIHNNDKERLSRIRPNINNLISSLEKIIKVYYSEINWQPEVKPVNLMVGIYRDLLYWKLRRQFNKYCNKNNHLIFLDFILLTLRLINKCLLSRKNRDKWLRSSTIELYLTDKHIKALSEAAKNNSDYLLVFEDDAIFKENSINKMITLIKELEKNSEVPTYIDLGGSSKANSKETSRLETNRDTNFKYYSKPITNTICCYLANKKQITLFNQMIIRMPNVRYIAADWMFNKLFIKQTKDGIKSNSRHAEPTFFDHGSAIGGFRSSIR